MHANGTDSVANREALRHWKGRGREERNKIRRNNEGAFWETVVREIKAENHVTAKSFERAYTKSLQCIFFARSFKRCHGWRVSAWMFHEAPPPTTRLARTCECPRFDTIPRKSLSRQGMLHLIKTYRIVWFFFFFFFVWLFVFRASGRIMIQYRWNRKFLATYVIDLCWIFLAICNNEKITRSLWACQIHLPSGG